MIYRNSEKHNKDSYKKRTVRVVKKQQLQLFSEFGY